MQDQTYQAIFEKAKRLPNEALATCKSKITDCVAFNMQIKEEVNQVVNQINTIKEKLQNCVWNQQTNEGLLTHGIAEYTACFRKIDVAKLSSLLEKDLQIWNDKLTAFKTEEEEKMKKLQDYLTSSKQTLESILNKKSTVEEEKKQVGEVENKGNNIDGGMKLDHEQKEQVKNIKKVSEEKTEEIKREKP